MSKSLLIFLCISFSTMGFTQPNMLDTKSDNRKLFIEKEKNILAELDRLYISESGCGKDYVNGVEYMPYYFHSQHVPLLRSGTDRTASLVFKRRFYDNLNLQYDTFQDKLLYADNKLFYNNRLNQIALNAYNITRFDLRFSTDTLDFRYFSHELYADFNLEDGFYEVVYDGRCKYLIKHGAEHYVIQGVDEYAYKPVGYIRIDNEFIRINPRKQFANLFGNKSKEIKNYMSAHRIRIYKADKHQIADILRYYESIMADSR